MKNKQEIEQKIKELNKERLDFIKQRDEAKMCSIEAEVSHNLVVIKAMQMQILEWCLE